MKFSEQIALLVLDKLFIGSIILIFGYWINKRIERFKVEINQKSAQNQKIFELENQLQINRLNAEIKFIETQISEFYWPIYLRLEKDNSMWKRIQSLSSSKNTLPTKVSEGIEKDYILKNHEEIVKIIEFKIHLIGNFADNKKLMKELLRYIKHVSVYRTIRTAKERQKLNPIDLNEPFPEELFPLIETNFHKLQERYEKLKKIQFRDFQQN